MSESREINNIEKRGKLSKLFSSKPKFLKKTFSKKKSLIKELNTILKSIKKIEKLKDTEGNEGNEIDKRGLSDVKDEVVETLLIKVFTALKDSELLNPIIRFSLTDDTTREGLIDVTIELLKARVIPWTDIFNALKDSGLAVDILKFLLTDPEAREGQIDLVLELIPRLLEDGVISLDDILKRIPLPSSPPSTSGKPLPESPPSTSGKPSWNMGLANLTTTFAATTLGTSTTISNPAITGLI